MRCEKCGITFEQRVLTQRFCSNECKFESRKRQVEKRCKVCDAAFSVRFHRKEAMYCSLKCKGIGGRREITRETKAEEWNRFVAPKSKAECWPWKGTILTIGYGSVRIGREFQAYAHRVSYELFVGEIPDGKLVCHKCDNRPCCNPDHLFLGSISDNVADMTKKGRASRGERRPKSKLNDEAVRAIRTSHFSQTELAETYGVSTGAISAVIRRKTWRHVE